MELGLVLFIRDASTWHSQVKMHRILSQTNPTAPQVTANLLTKVRADTILLAVLSTFEGVRLIRRVSVV